MKALQEEYHSFYRSEARSLLFLANWETNLRSVARAVFLRTDNSAANTTVQPDRSLGPVGYTAIDYSRSGREHYKYNVLK